MGEERYKITIQKSTGKQDQLDFNKLKDELFLEIKRLFKEQNKKEIKKHKKIEEQVSLFLEYYIPLLEYIKNAKEDNFSKENLKEAEQDIIKLMMESNIDKSERESNFSRIFQNLEKTEVFVNFLTNTFNYYIRENIKFENKVETNGRKNVNYSKKYRTAILLKEYYMNGKELDQIGLYTNDVFTTGSSEYQHKFLVDKRVLIQNLSPLIFGFEGIDYLRNEK